MKTQTDTHSSHIYLFPKHGLYPSLKEKKNGSHADWTFIRDDILPLSSLILGKNSSHLWFDLTGIPWYFTSLIEDGFTHIGISDSIFPSSIFIEAINHRLNTEVNLPISRFTLWLPPKPRRWLCNRRRRRTCSVCVSGKGGGFQRWSIQICIVFCWCSDIHMEK